MKRTILSLLSAVILLSGAESVCAHSPSFTEGLAPALGASGKWGYLNKKGEWALPAKVDRASEFSCGRALIKIGEKYHVIDKSGKVKFACEWDVPARGGFSCNLLRLTKDGKHGFFDLNGRIAIDAVYDDARDFSEDMAAVSKEGKWGFIGTDGRVVLPLEWDRVGSFSEGLAAVSKERKAGFIDKTGKLVIPLQYSQVKDFQHGIALVYDGAEKRWGVINAEGSFLTEPKWQNYPSIVGDDRIVFQDGDLEKSKGRLLWGLADSKGKVIVEPKWTRVGTGSGFSSGLAVAVLPGTNDDDWNNGKHGYIDRDGTAVIPYKFDYTNWFQDGMAYAYDDTKSGYIDTTGEFVFTMPE
jgi:hypothetical protein